MACRRCKALRRSVCLKVLFEKAGWPIKVDRGSWYTSVAGLQSACSQSVSQGFYSRWSQLAHLTKLQAFNKGGKNNIDSCNVYAAMSVHSAGWHTHCHAKMFATCKTWRRAVSWVMGDMWNIVHCNTQMCMDKPSHSACAAKTPPGICSQTGRL